MGSAYLAGGLGSGIGREILEIGGSKRLLRIPLIHAIIRAL